MILSLHESVPEYNIFAIKFLVRQQPLRYNYCNEIFKDIRAKIKGYAVIAIGGSGYDD